MVITRNVPLAVLMMTAHPDMNVFKTNAKILEAARLEAAQLVVEMENQMEEDAKETRTVKMVFAVVSGLIKSAENAAMTNTAKRRGPIMESHAARKTSASLIVALVLQIVFSVNNFHSCIVL